MAERSIHVLYGSQTGNAESIAKDICDKLNVDEIIASCSDLNAVKGQPLKELASCLVIVCSTTGNGDAPENASDWWRTVKLRSAAKDMFEGLPYTVLALGDTNYDKYCYMGKAIDKRLAELGGKRFMNATCADEGTGFEDTIETWKRTVLVAARKAHTESISPAKNGSDDNDPTQPVDEEKIGEEISRQLRLNEVSVNFATDEAPRSTTQTPQSSSSSSAHTPLPDAIDEPASPPCENTAAQLLSRMPEGILSPPEVAALLNLTEKLSAPPTAAQLPRAKACLEAKCPYKFPSSADNANGADTAMCPAAAAAVVAPLPPLLPVSDSAVSLTQKARSGSDHSLPDASIWTADRPFHATVSGARWLTTKPPGETDSEWGSWRRVMHLELSLLGSGIQYTPGDSIALCCPNAAYAVDIVLRRLQAAHPEVKAEGSDGLTLDTVVTCTADGSQTTLDEILSYKYDLMGLPKKASMLTLAQCCSDPVEATILQHLCSKSDTGKALWDKCVESQGVGVAELLALFPSCVPRLHQLLACLTPLPPRYYSISSSPLAGGNHLSIAFSIVRYACRADLPGASTIPIRRAGLCTTYLQNLLFPIVCKYAAPDAIHTHPPIKVRMFHKSSTNFHMPPSVAPPLILIGPGTGVSPFMGFLEHRQQVAIERRRSLGSEDCCMGMWRGGFELEEEDLPTECSSNVEAYMHSVEPGPIYLFFGCRDEHDYLFRKELQDYLCCHTLTDLDVAMSRVGPEKVYVTHKLRARAAEVARLILEDCAHVYICGDGNHMAKDVCAALKWILSTHGRMGDEETETMIQDMKLRRRYIVDIWS